MTTKHYSYNRKSAGKYKFGEPALLGIIVKKVLAERDPRSVIEAYTEDYIEDYEDHEDDTIGIGDYPKLGFLDPNQAEREAKDMFLQAYKAEFREWRKAGDPFDSVDWYDLWPRVPKWTHQKVAEAIGIALGAQAGRDAKALRDFALAQGY